MNDLPARKTPGIDHSDPFGPETHVARTRLASFLNVPTLFTPDGRLYRVVCVYKAPLDELLRRAKRSLIDVKEARPHEGLEAHGPLHSCEGVVFLPVESVVLCGAAEDLAETLETSGRLVTILHAAGVTIKIPTDQLPPPRPGSPISPEPQADPCPIRPASRSIL